MTYKHYLTFILIAGFLLSIAYSFYFQIQPSVDAGAYDSIAMNLISGNGYVERPGTPLIHEESIARAGPGYQFFLGAIYKIFGHRLAIVWIIQALIHAFSGLLIFLISKKIFYKEEKNELIGLISAVLFVFFIDTLELTAMVMTETLFLFLLLFSTFLTIDFLEEPKAAKAAAAALVFGFGILTRPTILPLLLIVVAFLVYRKYYRYAALFLTIPFLIVGPWTLRNYAVYNTFILTNTIGGINLWMGNNIEATGESQYTDEMTRYIRENGFVAAEKKGIEEAKKFIFSYPLKFLKLLFVKASIYFSLARPAAFWFHLKGASMTLTAVFSSLFAFIIFSSGTAGAISALKKKRFILNLLLSFLIITPLMVLPLVIETRYRYQIYPLFAIFGGLFLANFLDYWKNPVWRKVFLAIVLILILNSGFDLLTHLDQFQKYMGKIL